MNPRVGFCGMGSRMVEAVFTRCFDLIRLNVPAHLRLPLGRQLIDIIIQELQDDHVG